MIYSRLVLFFVVLGLTSALLPERRANPQSDSSSNSNADNAVNVTTTNPATNDGDAKHSKPKPKPPPPKPKPPARCADVLLYDTFGDGWNSNVVFQSGEDSYQLLDLFDSNGAFPADQQNCSTRVLQFCNEDESYEFSVRKNGTVLANDWEVFWAVKYNHKSYYGSIGSSVVIKGHKVDYLDLYDESPGANECSVCNTTASSLQIKLRDAGNNGWYSVWYSDIAGFTIPDVLVHPRFVVTDSDGVLVSEGTLCSNKQVFCSETFQDGTYFVRFAGLSQGDETWEFCNTVGFVGEELEFSISGDACTPVLKTTYTEQCYFEDEPAQPAEVVENVFSVTAGLQEEGLNSIVSYYLAGISFVCFAVVAMIKYSKKDGFESLPTESAHSTI